jgi:N-acetylmuramoyl-L-alanine amidase
MKKLFLFLLALSLLNGLIFFGISTHVAFAEKVRVLVVPGHEPHYGGANFGKLYEHDLTVELGKYLETFLKNNSRYQVTVSRDADSWNGMLASYFNSHMNEITAWQQQAKKTAPAFSSSGEQSTSTVMHVSAPSFAAFRLFGITKWANENKTDLMIHLHLNDTPERKKNMAGKYSGFSIYVPALQNGNSSSTKGIANAVFKRLSLYNPVSDYPPESKGIIQDPDLIALGVNNTANSASMLIEYDYLYQPQFVNAKVRSVALKDLAYQTYLGVEDYFSKVDNISVASRYYPSRVYVWKTRVTSMGPNNPKDIYALQTALIMDGDYPPIGKTKNECPHSGNIGACTKASLAIFQKKYGITGESFGGKKTFAKLNAIYMKK